MQSQKLLCCLAVVLTGVCAFAQGTFQNLDFEQANDVPLPDGLLLTVDAFPGWTVYASSVPQQFVSLDGIVEGLTVAALAATPGLVLDGNFSAMLAGSGLGTANASIGQSGVIPAGTESLRFLASGLFSVSFAGHPLQLQDLGTGLSFGEFYGADVSAYAGQSGQLLFQAGPGGIYEIDDISFSAQPIAEPGVLSILGLGALTLLLAARARRARSPTRHRA